METLLEVYGIGLTVGIIPLLLGFLPSFYINDRKNWAKFSVGMALGFLSLFFTDLINDSGALGVSSGLPITLNQILLAGLFFLSFSVFMMIAGRYSHGRGRSLYSGSILLAYLVAGGIGLHALGEGMIVGNSLASRTPIGELSSLIQGFSFSLHKFLEGFTVAIFFGRKPRIKRVIFCALLATVPYMIGIPLGLFPYPAILADFFFAAGAGAVLFMILQLTRGFSLDRIDRHLILGFLAGFLLVYVGTLIHFTAVSPG
ncbi:MAG TPA: hypothetical protein VJZ75_06445 [Candidatus Bathyarchaeia archaeon]|nr:hypothetical protein [Candidatus Bathyarchaeia archaeon]